MFLTEPAGHHVGDPTRARPCRCHRPLGDADGCLWCGRLWVWVIDRTWEIHGPQAPVPHGRVPAERPRLVLGWNPT